MLVVERAIFETLPGQVASARSIVARPSGNMCSQVPADAYSDYWPGLGDVIPVDAIVDMTA